LYDLTLVIIAYSVIKDDKSNFGVRFGNKIGFRKTNAAVLNTEIIEGLDPKYDKFDISKKTEKKIA
jgi:hypothetical protein